MWRRQRKRQDISNSAGSGSRQRIVATYAVVLLAIVLLWLLPFQTASTLSAQVVALIAAFAAVHLAWWMYGDRPEATSVFRRTAARELARRGHARAVLIDGVAGWGWPVGLFVVAADSLGRGGMPLEAIVLHAAIWSLAGAAVGQLLWSLSEDAEVEAEPERRREPVMRRPSPPPVSDTSNAAANLLLSPRA